LEAPRQLTTMSRNKNCAEGRLMDVSPAQSLSSQAPRPGNDKIRYYPLLLG